MIPIPRNRVGTGRLARQIATELANEYELIGVTRHQLCLDERIPYTAKNSSAAICLSLANDAALEDIFEQVRTIMLGAMQPGSDPGLCLAPAVKAQRVLGFGKRAKAEIVSQSEARSLAAQEEILCEGLGGSQDGIIGALASVGLAAWGEDGRYIQIGRSRELGGLQPVPILMEAGIRAIQTLDNQVVKRGLVFSDKLRPARRSSRPVLYVEWSQDHWEPLKLD